MERTDAAEIIGDLQMLIYSSSRDLCTENDALSMGQTLCGVYELAAEEFARPSLSNNSTLLQQKGLLDQQLNRLRHENRTLQSEVEDVMRSTAHIQQSHRLTMEALMRGEVPGRYPGDGWLPAPLEDLLATSSRTCEVRNLTPSEEVEKLQVFANSIRSVVNDGEKRIEEQRRIADRVEYENFVMRHLLNSSEPSKVDPKEMLENFRRKYPLVCHEHSHVPAIDIEEVRRRNEKSEADFWAEHEADRKKMEDKADPEEEDSRKDATMNDGISPVEKAFDSMLFGSAK